MLVGPGHQVVKTLTVSVTTVAFVPLYEAETPAAAARTTAAVNFILSIIGRCLWGDLGLGEGLD